MESQFLIRGMFFVKLQIAGYLLRIECSITVHQVEPVHLCNFINLLQGFNKLSLYCRRGCHDIDGGLIAKILTAFYQIQPLVNIRNITGGTHHPYNTLFRRKQ